MFNDLSSPAALLATRRSGKARDLVAPGPDAAQLDRILAAAVRVPDHGKLGPWRFVIVPRERREDLALLLGEAFDASPTLAGGKGRDGAMQFAREAPCLVVALSTPAHASHIPIWEQELSAGAACQTLLLAAHAEGFAGSWLTGWAAYSDMVRDAFGAGPGDRIAGFLFIGTPVRPLEERPRPSVDHVVSVWPGR